MSFSFSKIQRLKDFIVKASLSAVSLFCPNICFCSQDKIGSCLAFLYCTGQDKNRTITWADCLSLKRISSNTLQIQIQIQIQIKIKMKKIKIKTKIKIRIKKRLSSILFFCKIQNWYGEKMSGKAFYSSLIFKIVLVPY